MEELVILIGFLMLAFGAVLGLGIWRLVLSMGGRRDQREILRRIGELRQDVADLRRLRPADAAPEPEPEGAAAAQPEPSDAPVPPADAPAPAGVEAATPAPVTPPPEEPGETVPAAGPPPLPAAASEPTAAVESDEPPPERPENSAVRLLRRAWNWFIVNEEFRPEGVSAEYAIATTWLIRFGILILLLGMVFMLALSIKRSWVGPIGRVVLSIVTGVGMIAGGVRLVNGKYRPLAQGLIGGGLAVLYFAFFAASSQMFELIPDLASFAMMIVVTVSAAVLSERTESKLTAILGLIGGYATPFLLAGSGMGYSPLFVYLLLLGAGVFALAYRRQWVLLNYLGFLFTWAHVANVAQRISFMDEWLRFLPFLVAFFLLYSAVVCVYNLANRRAVSMLELFGLAANAAVFFGFAFAVVESVHGREWGGLVPLGLSVFYTGLVYVSLRRGLRDRPLMLTLLAMAGVFAPVTLLCILSEAWLTAGWALQALVLLWLSRKLNSRFLRYISYLLYALTLGRLAAFDLGRQFVPLYRARETVLSSYLGELVGRFFAIGVPIACFLGAWRLGRVPVSEAELRVHEDNDVQAWVKESRVLPVFLWCAIAAGFVYAHFELDRMFVAAYMPLRHPVLTGLWVLLGAYALVSLKRTGDRWLQAFVGVLAVLMVGKFLLFDLVSWDFRPGVFRYGSSWNPVAGLMRLLDFGLVMGFFAWAAYEAGLASRERARSCFAVLAGIFLFAFLTLEVNTFFWVYVKGLRAGAVSILWSVFALAAVFTGIRRDSRALRFCGLGLFVVAVGKVLLSDLSHLDPGWRILAFIVLGCIVLLGALVYLKNQHRFMSQPDADEELP